MSSKGFLLVLSGRWGEGGLCGTSPAFALMSSIFPSGYVNLARASVRNTPPIQDDRASRIFSPADILCARRGRAHFQTQLCSASDQLSLDRPLAVAVRFSLPYILFTLFRGLPNAHSLVPPGRKVHQPSVSRLPSFLWKRFSTRYSSVCCAILPAQKALDNEIPFSPTFHRAKRLQTD